VDDQDDVDSNEDPNGEPLFSFEDDAPPMPHWSEPATGEIPIVDASPPDARGGSRLFPQLPDDPGLIDDGPTTGVLESLGVVQPETDRPIDTVTSPTGIDLGGSLAGGITEPSPTGPMDDVFAAAAGHEGLDADLPAPRWGAATSEPIEGFLGDVDPDALATVQSDLSPPPVFDGPGAEFARRGDEFMSEGLADFDRVVAKPAGDETTDPEPAEFVQPEPEPEVFAQPEPVEFVEPEPEPEVFAQPERAEFVQPEPEDLEGSENKPDPASSPISIGTTLPRVEPDRSLDREDLNAWSSSENPSPVWRESAKDYETHRPADDAAERMVLHIDDESSDQNKTSEPSGSRNMPVAIGVGLALAALFLFLVDRGPGYAMIMVVPLLVLAASEFFVSVRKVGYRPALPLGLATVAGLPLAAYWRGIEAVPLVLTVAMIFALLWYLFGIEFDRPTANVSVTLLGIMWVGLLGSYIPLVLKLPNGSGILLGAIIGTVSYDVAGLFIGRATGQSRLAPNISPNKTYEGLIGGMIIAILVVTFGLGLAPGLAPWDLNQVDALMLGIVVAVVAPLGDLAQSLIKRDLGIKDMGSALPGHGGVFDRFDALLLVVPAVYYVALARDLHLLPI